MERMDRIERRLKLHDVRVLLSVVQAGSMHKAAESLGTSQPAVSRSISDLEQTLGVRLLDRSRRGVEPTHYGRAIIKRGIAVFDELRQGVRDIEFLTDPTAGELRIGCSEGLAAGPVFAAIDRLTTRHPRMAFKVVTGTRAATYRELRERNVELLMSGTVPLAEENVVAERLFDDFLVVAAGLGNAWARRRKIALAELVNEPWTLPPPEAPPGALAVEAFRASGLEPPQNSVITESVSLRGRLLATGRFLTMLPNFAFTPSSRNPLHKALPVELPTTRRTVAIITLRNRTLSPLAELFIKTAREVTKPLAKLK
jgi:DNA-binding transcriptional LysR family regulator